MSVTNIYQATYVAQKAIEAAVMFILVFWEGVIFFVNPLPISKPPGYAQR